MQTSDLAPLAEPTAAEVAKALQAPSPPLLLDVREAWEFAQGSLPNALHAPLSNFAAAVEALGLAPEQKVVTFCHHGVRSLRAGMALRQAGFTNVSSMAGGIDAWSLSVDDRVPRY